MRIIVEHLAEIDVSPAHIKQLHNALESKNFADVCCIGAFGGATVYLRCPSAPHGVIVNTNQMTPNYMEWILRSLEGSVVK